MVIDKSFEKYLLAVIFCRMQSGTARQFSAARILYKDSENPLQSILGHLSPGLPSIEYIDGLYAYLSTSPFIYSVMKDLYDFAPKEKLTTKAHLVMTLNVISDLLKKDSEDARVPENFKVPEQFARLKRLIEREENMNRREVNAIIN